MEEPTSYSMAELIRLTPEFLWGPLLKLNYPDLMRFCAVSKDAKNICDTDAFWELKTRRDFGIKDERPRGGNWKEEYKFLFNKASQDLIEASEGGDVGKVRELLDFGANPNLNESGFTALLQASYGGHTDVVRLLLKNGADVNLRADDGWSALMLASDKGHPDVVRLLLDAGADPNLRSDDGWSALMLASDEGHTDVVRLLLDAGADPNLRTEDGYAALFWASNGAIPANIHTEIVDLLKEYGAR